MNVTTIQLSKKTVKILKGIKEYPNQTYDGLIRNLLDLRKKIVLKNQYDEFLHKIQQKKMKELWDNREDEVWENA